MRKPLTPSARGQPVIRPDAKRLARPKIKLVMHGGTSSLLTDELDRRTLAGRAFVRYRQALVDHLGGNVTAPQAVLVDTAAKLQLLANIAWTEVHRAQAFDKRGGVRPAFDAFIRVQRELRSVLETLGLKRQEKELTLNDYLNGAGEGDGVFEGDTYPRAGQENPAGGHLVDPETVLNPPEGD